MSFFEYGFAVEKKGETPSWFKQVHGKQVLCLDNAELGSTPEADAGFTRIAGKTIYAFTADCLPVLLHGTDATTPVAAIHAGWRGAMRGVVSATVQAMSSKNLKAILGPSIASCCFEIQQDFIDTFQQNGRAITAYIQIRGAKRYCDLVRFVVEQELVGIEVDASAHRCTVCSQPLLPSYRRNGKADPLIRSFIRIKSAGRK
jgi:YfiH family protein